MNGEEKFEQDLRAVLSEMASQPAPERLAGRVAAIPVSSRSVTGGWRLGVAALGAAAVVAVIVVGALLMRPLGSGPSVGGPASNGPSGNAVAPASPSASPSTASPAPSGSPVVAPTGASGPAGGPVPAGFEAASVTFVSADEGWVLGTAPCANPPCTSILRTVDGGRTWAGIPAPRVPLAAAEAGTTPDAGRIRFADPMDGWVFGSSVWATHDGGASWHEVHLAGLSAGDSIWSLETADTLVHAVLFDGQSVAIVSSIVGRDDWRTSPTRLQIGAGPVPSAQLVLHGRSGWVLENDRTVVDGARLDHETWTPWKPPCLDVAGPAVIAAASASNVVAICDVGEWATPQGEHLYLSSDGGVSFKEQAVTVPARFVGAVAAGESAIVASGTAADGTALVATFDGGKSWSQVARLGSVAGVVDLGFTTSSQGVAVATNETGAGSLLMTRDGGHTWAPVAFTQQ